MNPIAAASRRYDSIDALRAVAVILVMLYHYTARFETDYVNMDYQGFQFSFGKYGVQLFFILSGYCIFLTLAKSESIIDFLARRLARLYPALLVCATVTFIAGHVFLLPGRTVSLAQYFSNILFLFPLTENYVDTAYWSLTVEVKYYFLLALIFYLKKDKVLGMWGYFTTLGFGVWIASLLLPLFGLPGEHFLAMLLNRVFIFPHSLWFLVGMALYSREKAPLGNSIFFLAVPVFYLAIRFFAGNQEQAIAIGLLSILGSIGILAKDVVVPKPLVFVGLISYPLYLIHQNVGLILLRSLPFVPPVPRILIVSAVLIAFAALVYCFIEEKYRRKCVSYCTSLLVFCRDLSFKLKEYLSV